MNSKRKNKKKNKNEKKKPLKHFSPLFLFTFKDISILFPSI